MATQVTGIVTSLLSSGQAASAQYKCIVATSSASDGGFAVVAVRGAKLSGILQDNTTEAVSMAVMHTGVAKVAAGDSSAMPTAITQGVRVVASSNGQAVGSTAAGQFLIGIARESLATGSTGFISVQLDIGAITT